MLISSNLNPYANVELSSKPPKVFPKKNLEINHEASVSHTQIKTIKPAVESKSSSITAKTVSTSNIENDVESKLNAISDVVHNQLTNHINQLSAAIKNEKESYKKLEASKLNLDNLTANIEVKYNSLKESSNKEIAELKEENIALEASIDEIKLAASQGLAHILIPVKNDLIKTINDLKAQVHTIRSNIMSSSASAQSKKGVSGKLDALDRGLQALTQAINKV